MISHADTFIFSSYYLDRTKKECTFRYITQFQNGEDDFVCEEKLLLPTTLNLPTTRQENEILDRILFQIHLMLGISYWKMYLAKNIQVKSGILSKGQANFWNTLYTDGMGEFWYTNNLDPNKAVSFPYKETRTNTASAIPTREEGLLGIGGGKDSLVSAQLLKDQQYPFTTLQVENHHQRSTTDEVIEELGVASHKVIRILDPTLTQRTHKYSGHIPISAVYGWIGVLMCFLGRYRFFIVSNEYSANSANTTYKGKEINHQWSKTQNFEEMFRTYVHHNVSPDITYFSLLRPLHEIQIVQYFAQHPQYFSIFSSCNRNFALSNKEEKSGHRLRWCGTCPKCAFAFILLAAFLPKEQVLSIFGRNLLTDENLMPLYKELLGVEGIKPFDCVGTDAETQVAFYLAYQTKKYIDDVVMQMFKQEVLSKIPDIEQKKSDVLSRVDRVALPPPFGNMITTFDSEI